MFYVQLLCHPGSSMRQRACLSYPPLDLQDLPQCLALHKCLVKILEGRMSDLASIKETIMYRRRKMAAEDISFQSLVGLYHQCSHLWCKVWFWGGFSSQQITKIEVLSLLWKLRKGKRQLAGTGVWMLTWAQKYPGYPFWFIRTLSHDCLGLDKVGWNELGNLSSLPALYILAQQRGWTSGEPSATAGR